MILREQKKNPLLEFSDKGFSYINLIIFYDKTCDAGLYGKLSAAGKASFI